MTQDADERRLASAARLMQYVHVAARVQGDFHFLLVVTKETFSLHLPAN